MVQLIDKDTELLARVAVDCPPLAGTILRLCNVLEDAKDAAELPPPDVLRELGRYIEALGQLVAALATVRPEAQRPDQRPASAAGAPDSSRNDTPSSSVTAATRP